MPKYYAVLAALLLAGCVSMGTNYDVAAVDRLQVGMSKAEVIGLLGQPNQVVTLSGGGQKLVWCIQPAQCSARKPGQLDYHLGLMDACWKFHDRTSLSSPLARNHHDGWEIKENSRRNCNFR